MFNPPPLFLYCLIFFQTNENIIIVFKSRPYTFFFNIIFLYVFFKWSNLQQSNTYCWLFLKLFYYELGLGEFATKLYNCFIFLK